MERRPRRTPRPALDVENEPKLIAVASNLSLPADWPEERRTEFLRSWETR